MLRAADAIESTETAKLPSDEKAENTTDADGSASTPLPKLETAAHLLKRWQKLENRETQFKNSTIGRMRKGIDSWVRQPPTKPDAEEVLALRDWELDRDEHPAAEVVAWLDRIAAINPQPIQFALNGEKRVSRELTAEELKDLKFGPAAENGLRAAWGRSPVQAVSYTHLTLPTIYSV